MGATGRGDEGDEWGRTLKAWPKAGRRAPVATPLTNSGKVLVGVARRYRLTHGEVNSRTGKRAWQKLRQRNGMLLRLTSTSRGSSARRYRALNDRTGAAIAEAGYSPLMRQPR